MTPSPALPLSIPEIHQAIREAGGIVHSDGNIFFTRAEQFVVAGVLCDERSAAPSPALPREGQPGIPGQVRDHLVSPVPCEARTTQPSDRELLVQAAKALGWRVASYSERRSTGVVDGGMALVVADGRTFGWSPLHNDGDALRLAVRLQLFGSPEVAHFLSLERFVGQEHDDCRAHRRAIVRAAAAIGRAALNAARRDAADTEPHGSDELTSESAPGESADPQSQGDTQ